MCFAVAVGFVLNLVDKIFSFKVVRSLWGKAQIDAGICSSSFVLAMMVVY